MTHFVREISHLVKNQFPDVYKDEGPQFIQFVKAFYEWLEQTNQVVGDSRNSLHNIDIDTATDDFLTHFQKTYMANVPEVILGDKRFLQKHILDLYRSKGSLEGLRLLFRLLYNEEIEVYIPSYDMLRASDGKWIEKYYIEIAPSNVTLTNQVVYGLISGASAMVESHERHTISGKVIELIFVSHIQGQFLNNEYLYFEGMSVDDYVHIVGSVNSVTIQSSDLGFEHGDELSTTDGSGFFLEGVVKGTENIARGFIQFQLVDGGSLYSNDAILTITPLGSGTGANLTFAIGNTHTYFDNQDPIEPYLNVQLNAETFSFGVEDESTLGTANLETAIIDALVYNEVTVGSVVSITTTNPGDTSYDADVTVSLVDPYTGSNNAVITGHAVHGTGLVSEIQVTDSGFGYVDGEEVDLVLTSNTSKTVTTTIHLGGVGHKKGYWADTTGFLNSDKRLQDSFYYQEFSYEVRVSKSFDRYVKILKDVFHPVGNEPFGATVIYMSAGGFYGVTDPPVIMQYSNMTGESSLAIDGEGTLEEEA